MHGSVVEKVIRDSSHNNGQKNNRLLYGTQKKGLVGHYYNWKVSEHIIFIRIQRTYVNVIFVVWTRHRHLIRGGS